MTAAEISAKTAKSPRPRYLVGVGAALVGFAAVVVLVAGALGGWFGTATTHITLSPEFQVADDFAENSLITVENSEFNQLIADGKSFIVLSHLPGCTANILAYLNQYATERHIRYVYYPWSLFRETSYHDQIQYAPTIALFGEGRLVAFLRADADADIAKYNSYDSFAEWLDGYLTY